jgi:hypothetical protein
MTAELKKSHGICMEVNFVKSVNSDGKTNKQFSFTKFFTKLSLFKENVQKKLKNIKKT